MCINASTWWRPRNSRMFLAGWLTGWRRLSYVIYTAKRQLLGFRLHVSPMNAATSEKHSRRILSSVGFVWNSYVVSSNAISIIIALRKLQAFFIITVPKNHGKQLQMLLMKFFHCTVFLQQRTMVPEAPETKQQLAQLQQLSTNNLL